jgi:hypothetical protein
MSDPRHRVPEGDDEMARTYEAKQLPTSRATAIVRAATAVASCRAGRSTRHFVDLSLTLTNGPFSGRGLRVPIFLDGSDPRAAGLRACLVAATGGRVSSDPTDPRVAWDQLCNFQIDLLLVKRCGADGPWIHVVHIAVPGDVQGATGGRA